ncbi:hypothetical protein PV703_33215 [Streptomyces sp. ME01-24h]|nr:hypothetical protein [Streptomyces sp. ME01-24h]
MTQSGLIADLFAGPGGWSEGARMLGLADVGLEWDEADVGACGGAREQVRGQVGVGDGGGFVCGVGGWEGGGRGS